MITSQLKAGQVLVPPISEYPGERFKLMRKVLADAWSVTVLVLQGTVWVERSRLLGSAITPDEITDRFFTEDWLRKHCHRVCECQDHPSPDGVCELPIDDEKWVRNKGFCSWCFHKHSR